MTPRFELARYGEPYLSIATALLDFPLVYLDLTINDAFLQMGGADSHWFHSSFPSLNTLRLHFEQLDPRSHAAAARILHTFLKSSPAIHTLTLSTRPKNSSRETSPKPAESLLELATTGKNQLPRGAPALRTITIKENDYTITPTLALALNTLALKELFFRALFPSYLTPVSEKFWLTLAKRIPAPLTLTALGCPRLTPGVIDFLCSFSGLESLDFDMKFYPSISSDSGPDIRLLKEPSEDGLKLIDTFFNEVLPAHGTSLKVLELCGYLVSSLPPWHLTTEHLERIRECSSLQKLRVPIQYPGPDLVCFLLIFSS